MIPAYGRGKEAQMSKIITSIYKKNNIRLSGSDFVYYVIVNIVLLTITLTVLYPLIFIVAASFSSPSAVSNGKVFLWPVDFSLEGYNAVFKSKHIGSGYFNTFFYTIVGTAINVTMTMIAAYPLARKKLPFRGITFLLLLQCSLAEV